MSEKTPDGAVVRMREQPASGTPRGEVRYEVDLAVTIDSDHNFYAGFATNLSAGGLFIATSMVLPVGSEVSLTIHLGEPAAIVRGTGTVRWLRPAGEGAGSPCGIGVKLLEVQGDGGARIAEFLQQRQPLVFPITIPPPPPEGQG